MKNIIFFVVLSVFLGQVVFAQEADHVKGGRFSKTVQYNVIVEGVTAEHNHYNVSGKSTLDRIFFGETNSFVEFLFHTSFTGTSGLRIIKKTADNSCRIEVMYLSDSEEREAVRVLAKKENPILIPSEQLEGITLATLNRINEYNKEVGRAKMDGTIYKPYRPEAKSSPASKELAEKLHEKIMLLIDNFRAEGIPPLIADGDTSTFRCVVGNELWTLKVHGPQNRVLRLSGICRQIITDINDNEWNEADYLKQLDEIKF